MYGLSQSRSKYLAASSASTEGAKGRNDSRYFTLRLSVFCIVGERASPGWSGHRARAAEFHAPLEPAERLALDERPRTGIEQLLVVQGVEDGAGLAQAALDLVL